MIRALTVFAGAVAVAGVASAEFVGVELRNDAALDAAATSAIGAPHRVIRMFAVFDAPTEMLVAGQTGGSTGFGLAPGFQSIGSGFFQETVLGSDTAPSSGLFGFSQAVQFDTYVSLNRVVADGGDTTSLDPDFSFVDTNADALDDFVEGGWFNSNPSNTQGEAIFNSSTNSYEVFLGQFTVANLPDGFQTPDAPSSLVESLFEGQLSIFEDTGGELPTEHVVTFQEGAIPTPGSAALMSLGGLAALRRRRRS